MTNKFDRFFNVYLNIYNTCFRFFKGEFMKITLWQSNDCFISYSLFFNIKYHYNLNLHLFNVILFVFITIFFLLDNIWKFHRCLPYLDYFRSKKKTKCLWGLFLRPFLIAMHFLVEHYCLKVTASCFVYIIFALFDMIAISWLFWFWI